MFSFLSKTPGCASFKAACMIDCLLANGAHSTITQPCASFLASNLYSLRRSIYLNADNVHLDLSMSINEFLEQLSPLWHYMRAASKVHPRVVPVFREPI